MRFAARMMATVALTFLLVPALFADEKAKPAVTEQNTAVVNLRPMPGTPAGSMPPGKMSLFLPSAALPQGPAGPYSGGTTPRVELFLGYSYVRAMPDSLENRIVHLHGGNASLAYNFNHFFGLVADFGGYRSTELRLTGTGTPPSFVIDEDGKVFTYLFGPRFSYRMHPRVTPFIHGLFGVAHAGEVTISGCTGFPSCTPLPSENVFAMALGGGLDVHIHRRVALRVFQVDYLMTRFRDPSFGTGQPGTRNNLRLAAGIVFRFGGDPPPPPPPPPNRAPAATCAAERSTVYLGDIVGVRAQASDPDNDSLTYDWRASGGAVDGSGAAVQWNSAGLNPGTYAVRVRVDDGRGGSAECSVDIRLDPRPNRSPVLSCSVDRDNMRPGERVRIRATGSDPDGDSLTYTWRASSGQIIGSGASVQFDSSGLSDGAYSIAGRVDDGRGGTADCTASVRVEAPPAPPQATKFNECFFPRGSSRVDNVCKRILDDVALRLQNDSRGRVILVGFADGTESNPERLAGLRTDAVWRYLREKGIADTRVEARAGGPQGTSGRQNQRIDIIWVPEGATY